MNWQTFSNELGKLYHSGDDGFEGLITKLLESLTERKFFLAKSGSQGGKDIISEERGNRIFVECKHYEPKNKKSKPTEAELREKLADTLVKNADNIPDVWILVTTTHRIDAQSYESLEKYSYEHGIGFDTIDSKNDDDSDLATLCANDPDLTIGHLHLSKNTKVQLKNYLENLSKQANYSQRLKGLKEKFTHEFIGFDNYKHHQNQWLSKCLASESESRAVFGQALNIKKNTDFIPREKANEKLKVWIKTWKEHNKPFVMLGEEGDGKTWATATWLNCYITNPIFPPVIFINSKSISSNEPYTLLADVLKKQLDEPRNGHWEKRLKNWLHREKTSIPLFILVLDGLNENIKFDWRGLLESFNVEPWIGRVAIIFTCRTEYWKKHFEYLNYSSEHVWPLPNFDDEELLQALDKKGLNLDDIHPSLKDLIAKPRYFDLVVRLKNKIVDSGDITVERLIYEDWKDRIGRKQQIINDEDFLGLISEISEKFNNNSLNKQDIKNTIENYSENYTDVFEEFVSSKILVHEHGKYKVDENFLVIGLGKLLADEVWHISDDGITDIEETIAKLLEPQPGMDIKAKICGAAVYQALMANDFPESARKVLFLYWINQQNLEDETWNRIPAYFPVRPETYLNITENLWSSSNNNQMAQDMMMESFLKYREWDKIKPIFIQYFERWMSFVHIYGYTYQEIDKKEEKQKITKRLGENSLNIGTLNIASYNLEIIDDRGLLRLARIALAIISHQSRKLYIKAIMTGILAQNAMGYVDTEGEMSWILKTTPDNIWPLVEKEVAKWLDADKTIFNQAAYWLLTYYGSSEAYQLRQQLPPDLFPKYERDSCNFYPWSKENYQDCLSRTRFSANNIVKYMQEVSLEPSLSIPNSLLQKLESIKEVSHENLATWMGPTSEDTLLEETETTVCAFAPNILANILKKLANSLPKRNGYVLQKAAWSYIWNNMLIMTGVEKEAILQAWTNALDEIGSYAAEVVLFNCVIRDKNAEKQLEFLLTKKEEMTYFVKHKPVFKPLSPSVILSYLLKTQQGSDIIISNVLSFVSANPQKVADIEQVLTAHLKHNNSAIRANVLHILFEFGSLAAEIINKNKWGYDQKNHYLENYWGSLILCEYGTNIPYLDLLPRVSPNLAGYMLEKRGCCEKEILQYADFLMKMWKDIQQESIPENIFENISKFKIVYDTQSNDVNPDEYISFSDESGNRTIYSMYAIWGGMLRSSQRQQEPLKPLSLEEQENQRNEIRKSFNEVLMNQPNWFGNIFWQHGLREVVVVHQDYVKEWINAVLPRTEQSTKILIICQAFYQALCSVLLEIEPKTGLKLYDLLQSSEKIQFIDVKTEIEAIIYKLFSVKCNDDIISKRWYSYLDDCNNDQKLLQTAFVIQKTGRNDWLYKLIDKWLNSERMFDQARALKILGFLDQEGTGEKLQNWINTQPDSWLHFVAKQSINSFNKNLWAKDWFHDFLTNEDDIRAWGSFKVFLKCVDHRFWLWNESMITNNSVKDSRKQFYYENIEDIKKHIKENEKELKEKFLGMKIMKDQVWPWMDRYLD
ncbi:hypothetical protein QUF50_04800 [Thiotrichales bacterium HSG1]|nr:hypothetical protein [Thiotrichales bacterium HSG1]